jgi:hypothetical protein
MPEQAYCRGFQEGFLELAKAETLYFMLSTERKQKTG